LAIDLIGGGGLSQQCAICRNRTRGSTQTWFNRADAVVGPVEDASEAKSRQTQKVGSVARELRLPAIDQQQIALGDVEQFRWCGNRQERLPGRFADSQRALEIMAAEGELIEDRRMD